MKRPFISFITDFGPSTKGSGVLMATALKICEDAHVIELASNIDSFDIRSGARILESVAYLPIGHHVCVVDPGVGTKRKAIIIKTKRGDYLIGPDNGVLISATWFLGGIEKVVEITNEKYMQLPVSPVFHGRDIFIPAAAYLANGVKIDEFGKELKSSELTKSSYENAKIENRKIDCEIIHINKFGGLFVNVLAEEMHKLAKLGDIIKIKTKTEIIELRYSLTFGEVEKGKEVILDDDFGRVEIAVNMGNFADKHKIKIGDKISLSSY
ncbi:MAG: SAM-dependent chlorinase/fluorinase [Candidatus Micrarchaeota archaeon]|nr:SAM-dependent chlorinase/fluorinase [Candidatus Micrarchaeota archaeon]